MGCEIVMKIENGLAVVYTTAVKDNISMSSHLDDRFKLGNVLTLGADLALRGGNREICAMLVSAVYDLYSAESCSPFELDSLPGLDVL